MVCSPSVQKERKMNKLKSTAIPLTEEFICSAASSLLLSFSLSLCFDLSYTLWITPHPPPPISHSGSPVRLQGRGGIVRSDGWLSTFCCLPLRSFEIYRATDYQAWKPISLHIPLARSLLFLSLPSIHLFSMLACSLFYYLKLFLSTGEGLGEHHISMHPINCTRSLCTFAEQSETCFGCGYKLCASMTSLLSLLVLRSPGMLKPDVCASKRCNYNTRKGATVGNCALKIVIALLSWLFCWA